MTTTADAEARHAGEAEVVAKIVAFLQDQSIAVPAAATAAEIPLLEGDALDSLGIVQLTMFLGEEFEIGVEDDDFVEENFATVGTLARFVQAKRSS